MIFYLLGLLGYYRIINKPVPAAVCLLFFGVVIIPPATAVFLLLDTHWLFSLLFFFAGWFTWTFTEYFNHRFILHSAYCLSHRNHHIEPRKNTCWFTKQVFSVTATGILIYAAITGYPFLILLSGFLTGYGGFIFLHKKLHTSAGKMLLSQRFKIHELHHRFRDKHFGISVNWWDLVFNTSSDSGSRLDKYLRKLAHRKNINSSKTYQL